MPVVIRLRRTWQAAAWLAICSAAAVPAAAQWAARAGAHPAAASHLCRPPPWPAG